ncbi:EutN/CcmL family microcompartment protein [Pseudonocardia spinosispora]|uniref:EutN/CcmL family microcompartment protein n=1 Tax=Pseudonocardia spinosispora TaxID=103441 RepID=UPI001B7F89E6|nr:EutN/CcmL family microcompartment protein [Pseudonocardia spinosispora]
MLGKVVSRVWADRQISGLNGRRLVLVAGIGSDRREVAVDLVDAAPGVTVLVATDEAAAAAANDPIVDAAVVALVDDREPTR